MPDHLHFSCATYELQLGACNNYLWILLINIIIFGELSRSPDFQNSRAVYIFGKFKNLFEAVPKSSLLLDHRAIDPTEKVFKTMSSFLFLSLELALDLTDAVLMNQFYISHIYFVNAMIVAAVVSYTTMMPNLDGLFI